MVCLNCLITCKTFVPLLQKHIKGLHIHLDVKSSFLTSYVNSTCTLGSTELNFLLDRNGLNRNQMGAGKRTNSMWRHPLWPSCCLLWKQLPGIHVSHSSGPQSFWSQGPVLGKTIFPWTGVGSGSGGNGFGMIQAYYTYYAATDLIGGRA